MLDFLKKCLVRGALIILPAWLALMLLAQLLLKLEQLIQPISQHMPSNALFPKLLAVAVLLLICLLVGALMHSFLGRFLQQRLEKNVLERIPGYKTLRSMGHQMADLDSENNFKPALVEIEDALAPCFVVEQLAGEFCTVFVPSAPTPAAGTIYIINRARVHPIDVSVAAVFRTVSRWGNGGGELLAAMQNQKSN